MSKIVKIELNNYVKPTNDKVITRTGKYYTNDQDNKYFQYIYGAYIASPTNASIIDSIVNYIVGEGLSSQTGDVDSILNDENLRLAVTDYKIFGAMAFQVIYNANGTITDLLYLPVRNLAVNREEDILDTPTGYWYSFDWKNKSLYKPSFLPAYGYGEKNETEILYIKRPCDNPIFAVPDWQSGIQYCYLEEEMSNFYINHIKNKFQAGTIININQGVPENDTAQIEAETAIKKQLSGTSNSGQIIVSFNENKEKETTVTNIPIENAYDQFNFLSEEAVSKIMLAHKVNDRALFGIPMASGFSSTADQLTTSLKILYRNQIKPMRKSILSALEPLFSEIGITGLFFEDFSELKTNEAQPIQMKEVCCSKKKINLDGYGEDNCGEGYELIRTDDNVETLDNENELNDKINKIFVNLVSTGVALPNANSIDDGSIVKVRYRYVGASPDDNSREFCKVMMENNKIYRIEDLNKMSNSVVNPGWGPKGADKYDIIKYKGGGSCRHKWVREIYVNKDRTKEMNITDPLNSLIEKVSPTKAIKIEKDNGNAYVPPVNDPLMYIMPKDMPNKGFLPKNKQ